MLEPSRSYFVVQIVPLVGHEVLRERIGRAVVDQSLPNTLLLHGPSGIGKQRLALWTGQLLLCEAPAAERTALRPCGKCRQCMFAMHVRHPDLHWYFPRPRMKDSTPSTTDVELDYSEAVQQRLAGGLLYPPPSGADGIFVATVRAIVHQGGRAPAMGRRKVFVIGDAERMVPQEGAEFAANAFLKLLEEPLANTTIILTSSEPGSLIPTVKSRVVAMRVAPLRSDEMRAFAELGVVSQFVAAPLGELRKDAQAFDAFIRGGMPGLVLASESLQRAFETARDFLAASVGGRKSEITRAVFSLGAAGARAGFSDVLTALTQLLHERVRSAAMSSDSVTASRLADAVFEVEGVRELASGNVSPQLLGTRLASAIAGGSA
jgi:DNA polymerase-3 subunit delta'